MTQPVTVNASPIATTVYRCLDCEAVSEEAAGPLYECVNCSASFNRENSANDNHQCPTCYKFASKEADISCTECGAGEVEEYQGFQCSCHGEWHILG